MNKQQLEKLFDERYGMYNPINDTGHGIPTWNSSDYQDIKDFIFKTIIPEVIKSVMPKYNEISWSAYEDGYRHCVKCITSKAKDLYGIDL